MGACQLRNSRKLKPETSACVTWDRDETGVCRAFGTEAGLRARVVDAVSRASCRAMPGHVFQKRSECRRVWCGM